MKKKIALFLLLFMVLITPTLVSSQEREIPGALKSGIEAFGRGEYEQALLYFRDIILDSDLKKYYGDAYFWIGRSHLAQQRIEKAAQNIDYFTANYQDHHKYPDALYQKGRILFLQKEYENSIQQLYSYIDAHPAHEYNANALFWIGESFYALGHFEKAEKLYTAVIRDYPRSYKVEAAKYRKSLIELKQREQDLLKLLKISHEEYLKALEDFQQRERTYEQAISSYQRKLSAATSDNDNELISELNSDIRRLQQRLEEEQRRVAQLRQQLASNGSTPARETPSVTAGTADKDEVRRLLELKNRALTLKLFYIEWLQKNRESNS
jgi:TolA-binding protein